MNKHSLILLPFLLLSSTLSKAAYVHGVETTITGVSSYGSGVVTGDIKISVENTVSGCEGGYYVKSDNAGNSQILSIALSAFHSGTKVKINGVDSPRWDGSSANYCKIEGIHLIK